MADRFDLEQQILGCWNITDDIKLLNVQVLEKETLTKDEISNYLIGLHAIYAVKFEQLFETFEKLIQDKKMV